MYGTIFGFCVITLSELLQVRPV